ncbi:MAG: hypothetical protein GF317_18505, partial [Candidatus Lokiarchaeota archaeon]|nr:hypothetical protein [Candidatus Lokiarchaeota archaeon]MBD3201508.1 hypothetical protein [Candidatus Lokiarchaeota archaeon]
MSFELLKKEIIDIGLCQGCGYCVGSCKHLEMETLKPSLKDYCILERDGIECGKCYEGCPQIIQKSFEKQDPKTIYSLRSKDPEILKKATSGGFVTTMAKHLLEENELSDIVMVKDVDDNPKADVVLNPEDVVKNAGVVYGRSGVLSRLLELVGKSYDDVGIVGVPCEMRGAAELEKQLQRDILKIGLFCNASIRSEYTDEGVICSPCCTNCPAGVNAQSYISSIRAGNYQKAVDIIRE